MIRRLPHPSFGFLIVCLCLHGCLLGSPATSGDPTDTAPSADTSTTADTRLDTGSSTSDAGDTGQTPPPDPADTGADDAGADTDDGEPDAGPALIELIAPAGGQAVSEPILELRYRLSRTANSVELTFEADPTVRTLDGTTRGTHATTMAIQELDEGSHTMTLTARFGARTERLTRGFGVDRTGPQLIAPPIREIWGAPLDKPFELSFDEPLADSADLEQAVDLSASRPGTKIDSVALSSDRKTLRVSLSAGTPPPESWDLEVGGSSSNLTDEAGNPANQTTITYHRSQWQNLGAPFPQRKARFDGSHTRLAVDGKGRLFLATVICSITGNDVEDSCPNAKVRVYTRDPSLQTWSSKPFERPVVPPDGDARPFEMKPTADGVLLLRRYLTSNQLALHYLDSNLNDTQINFSTPPSASRADLAVDPAGQRAIVSWTAPASPADVRSQTLSTRRQNQWSITGGKPNRATFSNRLRFASTFADGRPAVLAQHSRNVPLQGWWRTPSRWTGVSKLTPSSSPLKSPTVETAHKGDVAWVAAPNDSPYPDSRLLRLLRTTFQNNQWSTGTGKLQSVATDGMESFDITVDPSQNAWVAVDRPPATSGTNGPMNSAIRIMHVTSGGPDPAWNGKSGKRVTAHDSSYAYRWPAVAIDADERLLLAATKVKTGTENAPRQVRVYRYWP